MPKRLKRFEVRFPRLTQRALELTVCIAARKEREDREREERHERHKMRKRERDERYRETIVINNPRGRPGRDREESDPEESVYEGDRVPDRYEGHRAADRERVKKAAGPAAEESAYEADQDTDIERVR